MQHYDPSFRLRCMKLWLTRAKDEYGDRTVSNVITQIESRLKHFNSTPTT